MQNVGTFLLFVFLQRNKYPLKKRVRSICDLSPLHLLLYISKLNDTFNDACSLKRGIHWLLNRHKTSNCIYVHPTQTQKVSLCCTFYVSYFPQLNIKFQCWQTNIWSWWIGRGGNWDLKMRVCICVWVCLCAHVQPMCLLLIIHLSGK